jgi:ubiquinone/menaquinone biosynthesis C-methylase UbiE
MEKFMSFPHHDRFWTDTAEFLRKQLQPKDKILAPDQFWWLFRRIYRYLNTTLDPDCVYEWVVIHKGELHNLSRTFLANLPNQMIPVFANEVFVIWASNPDLENIASDLDHLQAFFERLSALNTEIPPENNITEKEPNLPDQGLIVNFADLSESEFQEAMDKFWRNGGYIYETLRDQTYYAEIDRYISEFVGNGSNQNILDVCCGTGRLSKIILESKRVTGIDISEVAIEIAQANHQERTNFEFVVMDAHNLNFAEESFDTVLLVDSIEHIKSAVKVFAEIARVIKPNGTFFLTVANKNSLNQILTRKLGYQEFVTNYQHIQEFSLSEIRDLLDDAGFMITKTAGIFLYPYWGIPGIDEVVREITDNDPEVVEIMRVLGERVGAEYAYAFVILATKQVPEGA